MATIVTKVKRKDRKAERRRAREEEPEQQEAASAAAQPAQPEAPELDIEPDDPLLTHLQQAAGPVDIDKLTFDSPALEQMRAQGLKLIVPLVTQGELIGLLNLGPRLSEQEYSSDDRKLLENLAAQAAPAVRVAQLVREQQAEARDRERIEHELQVAQLIQQNFLPKTTPSIAGWEVAAYYRPARTVGGDFYDFIEFPDGRLGIVIGDVTDKGVPAALVMAATRSIVRSSATQTESPAEVLARVNDILIPDMPPNMFVTCLYGVLDPATGVFRFANAGHNLPYVRRPDGRVDELRATGMPLGLLEGMTYDVTEGELGEGDTVLFSSDGIVEAHDPHGEMFGFPRLKERMSTHRGGANLLDRILGDLAAFTGADWEQEDDVTMVTVACTAAVAAPELPATAPQAADAEPEPAAPATAKQDVPVSDGEQPTSRQIVRFSLPSEPGGERSAAEKVAEMVQGSWLTDDQAERLKTAVAEASMNAMEHGNEFRGDLPVDVEVSIWPDRLVVRITDLGAGPADEHEEPDLEAKLDGRQTPRGWGMFLIRHMVDELNVTTEEGQHTVELVLRRKGDDE
ncbi:MAG TPA: SpoIIE family protein phosphatase [Actinomycetota bacterium]|nr:SpoIIE family protein phosphatase [Actinomycetota bacterium]